MRIKFSKYMRIFRRPSTGEEFIGWFGVVVILLAYALASFDIIASTGILYQILNIAGAIGIVIISIKRHAYQPEVLNIIWAMIGVVALINTLFFSK